MIFNDRLKRDFEKVEVKAVLFMQMLSKSCKINFVIF